MPVTLVLVTNNFPFLFNHGEVTFVGPELAQLKTKFDRVIIAPCNAVGRNVDPNNGCEIDLTLSEVLAHGPRGVLRSLPRFARSKSRNEYLREACTCLVNNGPKALRLLLLWSLRATEAEDWARMRFDRNDVLVFYTYWNTGVTKGLIDAALTIPNWSVVTRVHGFDLYHDIRVPQYLPFRPTIYRALDRTYAISKHGYDFLIQHGAPSDRVALARLGILDPGFRKRTSSDGKFRIVSCSFLSRKKRVPLLASSLCELAKSCTNVEIEWSHIGNGEDREVVERVLASRPPNLTASLIGQVPNSEVIDFYRQNQCDLFVHLSESEGIPVSMMEACSIGLPILATDVGGVREIVTEENGILLGAAPTVADVVKALRYYIDLSETEKCRLSIGARSIWSARFRAEVNHNAFAGSLMGLVKHKQLAKSEKDRAT